jgi:hypothetical protein
VQSLQPYQGCPQGFDHYLYAQQPQVMRGKQLSDWSWSARCEAFHSRKVSAQQLYNEEYPLNQQQRMYAAISSSTALLPLEMCRCIFAPIIT